MMLVKRIQRVRAAKWHTTAGLQAYAQGDLELAEAELVSALWFAASLGVRDDTARRAYLNLAVVHIEAGNYEEGRQLLRHALATDMTTTGPGSWEPMPLRGDDAEVEDDDAIGRLIHAVRRALGEDSLDPERALRSLAAFEQRSDYGNPAPLVATLADSLQG